MLTNLNESLSIFILIAVIITTIVFVINYILLRLYRRFIMLHSQSYNALRRINNKYNFSKIEPLYFHYQYDNKTYFYSIQPLDYLIYSLRFKEKETRKQIELCLENERLNNEYKKEIKEKCLMSKFDMENEFYKKDILIKLEKKMCKEILKKPVANFSATVVLSLCDMSGKYLDSKREVFSHKTLDDILLLLSRKKNGYYEEQMIRDSINLVEHGKVSNKLRFAIYQRDNYRCRICGKKSLDLEIDHIYPVSKGGKSVYSNLQTLCHKCNQEKGNKILK